jgi:ankyrin repeat protein
VATLVKIAGGKVISMQQISTEAADPRAEAAVGAVRSGDAAALARVLTDVPALAGDPVPGYRGRTLLHIATDWPGYCPNGPEVIRVLIEHGAGPNHRDSGKGSETPLHWAASSDDVDVARALIDGGADIEAPDGSIGTPMDNAIGYGCWHVAALLAERGARVDKLWHAAALGKLDRLESLLASGPEQEEISQAFWHACAGFQRRAAERLLQAGADLTWSPDYGEGSPLDAASGRTTRQENVIEWLVERGATSTISTD